ncbi:MAG: hypothetical protein JWN03_2368 [Nocardia sp.]|nr:hypothetical protein [Nocardia sp.]
MRARALVTAGAITSAVLMSMSGTAAATPADQIPGDGLYLVNVDIKPGNYVSDGTGNADACFWRRLWHVQTDTDYNDPNYYVIASDFTRQHPLHIVIKATDVAFRTDNCGAWRPDPNPLSTGSS